MTCNVCMSRSVSVHTCSEMRSEDKCPICHEFIFSSSSPIKALHCGHLMHSACFHVNISDDISLYIKIDSFILLTNSYVVVIRLTLVPTILVQFAASHLGTCRFSLNFLAYSIPILDLTTFFKIHVQEKHI